MKIRVVFCALSVLCGGVITPAMADDSKPDPWFQGILAKLSHGDHSIHSNVYTADGLEEGDNVVLITGEPLYIPQSDVALVHSGTKIICRVGHTRSDGRVDTSCNKFILNSGSTQPFHGYLSAPSGARGLTKVDVAQGAQVNLMLTEE